jgi:DNA-binding transcriptional ArsR family regulator
MTEESHLQKEIRLMHAGICQALADPKRILIMYTLHDQPYHVTALPKRSAFPSPLFPATCVFLHQHALVQKERDGAAVYYSLSDPRIIDALDIIRSVMADALAKRSELF